VRRILAWGVHIFTALGAVAGLLALLAIDQGAWHRSVLWMLVALAIDSLDGMMARGVGVSHVLPHVDGRRLDDVVDYLNYVIVPAVFLVATGLLPHWAWAAPPILASAFGFARTDAKTADGFFLGFPSYWNVVAIYAWLLEVPPAVAAAVVTVGSVLVFVPWKYIHPSQLRSLRRTTYGLTIACGVLVVYAVAQPDRARALHLVELSLAYPAWYLLLSFRLGGLHRRDAGHDTPRDA